MVPVVGAMSCAELSPREFSERQRVGAGIDGGEVVGATDGDGELFSALDAMAVVDLSGPSEFEGVAFFQPIEISGLRIEGPVDGLLSPLERSPASAKEMAFAAMS